MWWPQVISVLAAVFLQPMLSSTKSEDTTNFTKEEDAHPPGHMQPLGSHRPMAGEIERIDYVPDPVTFYEEYVAKERPVIFTGAVLGTPALTQWSDQYLKDNFGDEVVSAEYKKKEDRDGDQTTMSLREFVETYQKKDIYLVENIPAAMKKDLFLPGCIACGGYLDNLDIMLMWFSSGGTKSVLHTDDFHNMHCVVSGEKRFIMIPSEYTKVIGPEWEGQGFYNLDVEAVNMTAYPKMVDVPWYKAVLSPGDCMYLPYRWIHHVSSFHCNIGVNMWFHPFQLDTSNCSEHKPSNIFPLKGVNTTAENALNVLFTTEPREDGFVYAEDVHWKMKEDPIRGLGPVPLSFVNYIFDSISPESQGMIEASEFRDIKGDKLTELKEMLTSAKNDLMAVRAAISDYNLAEGKEQFDRHEEL